jgi:ATP-dependent helicase/nuclease subunit B
MRRVRALLARQSVPLLDETGWKLSTTRAGATIAGLLRAAMPRATTDDWLDWIKSAAPAWPGRADAGWSVAGLESTLRREAWVAPGQVDVDKLHERVAPLWRSAQDIVGGLRSPRSRSFVAWLFALRQALAGCGAWDSLMADDAGRQAIAALHLDDAATAASNESGDDALTLHEFAAWLDHTLEDAPFVPDAPGVSASNALVVITPLSRALLRPFAAVVFPGADEKRLGSSPPPHPLLSEAQAAALGVPGPEATRRAELLAFAHLLRRPAVTLLRRRDDGGEPLAPSPLLERLQLALQRAGRSLAVAADPATPLSVDAQPVHRPMPVAPAMLPARLSASAYEALRTCPYRFFSLRLLSLQEADELDDEVDKRDYGNWLHRVLHRFHAERAAPAAVEVEAAALQAIAQQVREEMALDEASFLPYGATFSRFVPRYLSWLHRRDAEGAQWLDGERSLSAFPPSWEGVEMVGQIDRIDSVPGDDGPLTELIDYKTGSAEKLREKVRRPSEDTQLAFYAALMAEQSEAAGPLAAAYLPLDESSGTIRPIEHKQVQHTAVQLVAGIGHDLARLRAGATMPALGEGSVCEYCAARGLCRRDHWPADEEPVA